MSNLQPWSPSILDIIAVFRLHCQAQRYAPATLRFYDERLPPFARWLAAQGVCDLHTVTPNHIRAYLVLRQEAGNAPAYVHGIGRALRAFFNFCVRDELLTVSPMRNVRLPKLPKTILPAFSPDDVRALLKAADHVRDRALVLFLLDTGVRARELTGLRVGDIDLKNGAVHIRQGKGAKDRVVYLGAKSLRALLRYYTQRGTAGERDALWVAKRAPHAPLTYTGLGQTLRKLGKDAGVAHCHAHTFRRTFALQCLRNGMNIYSLRRLMGHEDIDVLKHYLALLDSDDIEASRRFGVVDHL